MGRRAVLKRFRRCNGDQAEPQKTAAEDALFHAFVDPGANKRNTKLKSRYSWLSISPGNLQIRPIGPAPTETRLYRVAMGPKVGTDIWTAPKAHAREIPI